MTLAVERGIKPQLKLSYLCVGLAGPYYCAVGSLSFALGRCMVNPANIPVEALIEDTDTFASRGDIDDPANLQGSMVYIWHGGFDETVHPGKPSHS